MAPFLLLHCTVPALFLPTVVPITDVLSDNVHMFSKMVKAFTAQHSTSVSSQPTLSAKKRLVKPFYRCMPPRIPVPPLGAEEKFSLGYTATGVWGGASLGDPPPPSWGGPA